MRTGLPPQRTSSATVGKLVALLLIAVGSLYLLDLADVVGFGDTVGSWWPAGLIALGVVLFASRPNDWFGPALLVAVGVAALATSLGWIDAGFWSVLWPVLLIAFGLRLLLYRAANRSWSRAGGRDELDVVALFGGGEIAGDSQAFRGGRITAVFGGGDIDLTRATLGPDGARLAVTAILGAVEIVVPHGWRVAISGAPVLGAISDTTEKDKVSAGAPTLEVQAVAVLGGVEIKNPAA